MDKKKRQLLSTNSKVKANRIILSKQQRVLMFSNQRTRTGGELCSAVPQLQLGRNLIPSSAPGMIYEGNSAGVEESCRR